MLVEGSQELKPQYLLHWMLELQWIKHAEVLPVHVYDSPTKGNMAWPHAGPLFTKRTDILPQDLVKSRSHESECYTDRVDLKFDMHLGSTATEVSVKFQGDKKRLSRNL